MHSRTLALTGAAVLAVAGAVAAAAPASAHPAVPKITGPVHATYQGPIRPSAGGPASGKVTSKLATFSSTLNDGGTTFHYTLVGKNPAVQVTKPAVTIPVVLVPLRIHLVNGHVYDPTAGNTCDATPALTRVTQSPLVTPTTWKFNGVSIGKAQYNDAFRRAEFWQSTSPTGINPAYHVRMSFTSHAVVTVNVPGASSAEGTSSCGNEGAVEINWFDNFLNTTELPNLVTEGVVSPKVFPLFVLSNTVMFDTVTSNCCILGYHSATGSALTSQTYGVAEYESSDFFGTSVRDVAPMSHEIGEWMDDPFINNATKPWGNIGQVTGCQNNLEVGDPLSGTQLTKSLNGFAYHPQELAYFSWFFHQSPSLGAGGIYSNRGSFNTFAAPCP